jgi:GTPase SAR1 family protein
MTIKQIENSWRQNFKKSFLVSDGKFNSAIARQLYYGPEEYSVLPFKEGFLDFNDNCNNSEIEIKLDKILEYLHFIGITISKTSIINGIAKGKTSYPSILKKAFYIFKQLACYDEEHDIDDPYKDNLGDLYFFLRIEEGDNVDAKQLTLFDELELPDFYNKYIELPAGYENDKTAKRLFELIENSDKSIFLTGKAGTGKSTFIHYFTKKTEKNVLIVAFTGIAAINIGGQTIHSFFKFPFKPLLPNDPDITIFNPLFQKRKIIENTNTIIIDEVSMLRSDILEGLDYSLRMNGGNPNKLFGGKQLIVVGDIFQLPPIVNSTDEVESELFKIIYDSEYFFDSIAYKQLNPEIFEFSTVHRQSNEQFINLLNKVRDCSIDNIGIDELNKRYNPSFIPASEEFVITLTTNNYIAKSENVTKLNLLPYKSYFFKANINGDFKEDKYPTEIVLELKRNSQIMFVKNDTEDKGRRWVNGTIAKIDFIEDGKIEIRLKDGTVNTLKKETWENRQYQWDKKKRPYNI